MPGRAGQSCSVCLRPRLLDICAPRRITPRLGRRSAQDNLWYLAASGRVAYLNDDNWFGPDDLSASAARWKGINGRDRFDGISIRPPTHHVRMPGTHWTERRILPSAWVDPNSLMIYKIACQAVLRSSTFSRPNSRNGTDAEPNIFRMASDAIPRTRERSANGASML